MTTQIDLEKPHHYFLTSVVTWVTDTDLRRAIKRIDEADRHSGFTKVDVWFVPVDEKEHYQIRHYAPQVEGVVCIAVIDRAKKKKRHG